MKQRFEVTIDAGLGTVWAAFDDADNLPRWQSNLQAYVHKSGARGQPGAVTELIYDERGRKVVLKQTITERREPDFMAASYETPQATTLIVNHFEAIGNEQTRWSSWCNYRFSGLMKVTSLFVAGAIRKRAQGDMERFKLMVESDLAGQ